MTNNNYPTFSTKYRGVAAPGTGGLLQETEPGQEMQPQEDMQEVPNLNPWTGVKQQKEEWQPSFGS